MSGPLERSIRVQCPVEHAFTVFTDRLDLWWPPGHRRFEQSRLSLEARVGGRFLERSEAGEEFVFGKVLECDPPHRIVYTWFPGADDRPTEVAVSFTGDGGHTRIDVRHSVAESGLGQRWPERRALFERGWDLVLPALVAFIESAGGADRTRTSQ